ncbi:MAG: DNA-directed RNA polymerase subunit omega [Bacteroidota bacterium]|nr:DNA-directed RNA polymerase subunit omega [Bacteroidota bacterium]MEC8238732.1 DNA-directed RNA polymerase subunit omega [Bacteroidota bacterium]
MSIKNSNAPDTTITYNRNELDEPTGNIYKTVSILAKRSIQINEELRTELFEKLEEFATPIETLEEIFENKEQIEVSRFYEKLPKPHAVAVEQWLAEKIYYRHTDETSK